MPGESHSLDKDVWTEIPGKAIIKAGTAYVGKEYIPDQAGNPTYDVRIFVRKIEPAPIPDIEIAARAINKAISYFEGIHTVDAQAMLIIITVHGLQRKGVNVSTAEIIKTIQSLLDLKLFRVIKGTLTLPNCLTL